MRQTAAQAATVEPAGKQPTHEESSRASHTHSPTRPPACPPAHFSLTFCLAQYLIPLLLCGLLCSAALSSVQGEYDLPPRGVACGWALALVCCAPTPLMAWRAIKPCSRLWRRLRCGGDSAPPRIGDTHTAAGSPRLSPRRPGTRAGAALEMYAVHGGLQGAAGTGRRTPPQPQRLAGSLS